VHAKAEEEVAYPAVRGKYPEGDLTELYDEQAEMRVIMDEIKSTDPASPAFKDKVTQLKNIVMDHVRQEESTYFAAIRDNFSSDESEQLATQFKAYKAQLQQEMAAKMK
ncbi:MAG: DNA nickase, partial [Microcoleus sp. SIO2G3]|nr:DNA nickase [Microcoleus sp. SIO2G3]